MQTDIPVRIVTFPTAVRPKMLFALWFLTRNKFFGLGDPQTLTFYRFREHEPAQGPGNIRQEVPLHDGCFINLGAPELSEEITRLIGPTSQERSKKLRRQQTFWDHQTGNVWTKLAKWIHEGLCRQPLKVVAEKVLNVFDSLNDKEDAWSTTEISLPEWQGQDLFARENPFRDFDDYFPVAFLRELTTDEQPLVEGATFRADFEGKRQTKTTLRTSIQSVSANRFWNLIANPEPTVLYIGGDPQIGKSTWAASIIIWLMEIRMATLQSIWKVSESPLRVKYKTLDGSTPVGDTILRNERITTSSATEFALGQRREDLDKLKRPWTPDLVRETCVSMAEAVAGNHLVIADLPGIPSRFTDGLVGLPGFAIILNQNGRESVTHWRQFFGRAGIDVIGDINVGQRGSLISRYLPGRYVSGVTGPLRRVAKPGDACLQHSSLLSFWDIMPKQIERRWNTFNRARQDPRRNLKG